MYRVTHMVKEKSLLKVDAMLHWLLACYCRCPAAPLVSRLSQIKKPFFDHMCHTVIRLLC